MFSRNRCGTSFLKFFQGLFFHLGVYRFQSNPYTLNRRNE